MRENIIYLLMKVKLCVCKHSRIPDAFPACDRRFTEFIIKTMPVCFSTKGNGSGFIDVYLHVVLEYTTLECYLYLTGVTNCQKGILFPYNKNKGGRVAQSV